MKLQIAFIRGGTTLSGEEGRYLGMVDEPLSALGRGQVMRGFGENRYPAVSMVFSSGLVRCRESAALIYPNVPLVLIRDLRAFDFGAYSGKQYHEIMGERWSNADKLYPCPEGEDPYKFRVRCVQAFRSIIEEMRGKQLERVAVVSHNMVIKCILQRFLIPRSVYRDDTIGYAHGCILEYDPDTATGKLHSFF